MRAKDFLGVDWRKKVTEEADSRSMWSKVGKTLEPAGKFLGKIAPGVGAYNIAQSWKEKDYPGAFLGAAQMVPNPAVWGTATAADVLKNTVVDDPDSWLSRLPFRNIGPQGADTPAGQIGTKPAQAGTTAKPDTTIPAAVPPEKKSESPKRNWQELYQKNIDVVGSNPNLIYPGQKLQLPSGGEYTVKPGDSLSKIASQTQKPKTVASDTKASNVRYAADLNNPSGLGWNPESRSWYAFKTPEEGVAATQRQLGRYLSGQGYMKGVAPTPENVVSMWVTGGTTPAEKIQGGSYVQSVKKELANSGIKLGPNGEIPNTPDATMAITRAMTRHETQPKHQEKFQAALYPRTATQSATSK